MVLTENRIHKAPGIPIFSFLKVCLLWLAVLFAPALEAAEGGTVDPSQPSEIDRLVTMLESDEKRQDFLKELKSLQQHLPKEKEKSPIKLSKHTKKFFQEVQIFWSEISHSYHNLLDAFLAFFANVHLGEITSFALVFLSLMAALSVGWGGQYLMAKAFLTYEHRIRKAMSLGQSKKSHLIVLSLMLLLLRLGVLTLLASVFLVMMPIPSYVVPNAVLYVFAFAMGFGIVQFSRFLLLKNGQDSVALVSRSQDFCEEVHGFIRRVVVCLVATLWLLHTTFHIDALALLIPIIQSTSLIILSVFLFRFVTFLQENRARKGRSRVAWPVLIKLYVVGQGISIVLFGQRNFMEAVVKGMMTLFVMGMIAWILDHAPKVIHGWLKKCHSHVPHLKKREGFYEKIFMAILWFSFLIFLLYALNAIWDEPFWAFLWGYCEKYLSVKMIDLTVLTLLGLALWEGIDVFLNYLSRVKESTEEGRARAQRIKTLHPLIANVLRGILITVILLMVLSELGFNIIPLLTGASVLGVGVGLGAQNLVKDFLNGCFILVENTVAVGDFVEVGGHTGTVETLTLRCIVVRDALGSLHTVPYSAIGPIINYTRDFANSDFFISFDMNMPHDQAYDLLYKAEKALNNDPAFAPHVLGELNILGVDKIDAMQYTLKMYLKVAPGQQWCMRRAFHLKLMEVLKQEKANLYSDRHFIVFENLDEIKAMLPEAVTP